ncbi:MAG: Gfo/Idh/MocA family oxidoreductase [Caldilineaceae bacterium]|nr:Gfo/Idh/MocA family oxidoreductase [Caldilineaceae bacterium]
MSTQSLRVGVIGAGANTRTKHIPGLQAINGVEVVKVCNRTQESGQRVAAELGIPEVVTDWRDVIYDSTLDAIVIGTWPYMHKILTVAALEADKHVMCEARMSMNATEARAMYEAARLRPHLTAQIVPSPYSLRADRTIQRLLAEGWLGDLLAVEIRAGNEFVEEKGAPLHWRHDKDLSGLNIMSMGIWYEALMRWVGVAQRVTATGKTFVTTRLDSTGRLREVRIPDHIDILADLACGASAHIQVSSVTGLAGSPSATLYGSEGTLRFVDGKLLGGKRGDSGLTEIDIPASEAGAWRVEEEFVNAIRGQESITHTDFLTGVKYMEFTEAVNISLAEGRSIAL